MSHITSAPSALDSIDVVNPATGRPIRTIAAVDNTTVADTCNRASEVQQQWAARGPRERSELLRDCWKVMLNHRNDLADLIVAENGKPMADALGEVSYAAEFFRWNAEEAVRLYGSLSVSPAGANRIMVRHVPVGVVGVISPWNFPAAMITRKLAPALAAGNAAIVKPATETPLTALRIAELMTDTGIPEGLVTVTPSISASGWLDTIVEHPAVRMVSFTGSTEVGRRVLRRCADSVLNVGMELGGNAPFIVFDDADLDDAVAGAMTAKMRHSAQTCTAANRFFVQSGIGPAFTSALTSAMAATVVGPGTDPTSTCGPLINQRAADDVNQLVQGAVADGAVVRTGGKRPERDGFYFEPTVLANVAGASTIATTEIFGPVAPIIEFDDIDDVVSMANATELGLAAYVFTSDLSRGLDVSERLACGMIGLNRGAISDPAAPFGGMRQSGIGREGGTHGIYEFCETQYIAVNW